MKILIPVCFIVLLVSCWKRNDLPAVLNVAPELLEEPIQTSTYDQPFNVTAEGKTYEVQPLYDYDLHGLVVSYNHHNAKFGLHKSWGDHLNVADFCVIWGSNVQTAKLPEIDFWNGQFTCNVKTKNRDAWNSFDMNKLSNNHLITNDEYVRGLLNKINIGDQIRIQGKLVNYAYPQGGQRTTSTTRTDTGNGACETIYVDRVEILQAYTSDWRKVFYGALITFILLLGYYFMSPYKAN